MHRKAARSLRSAGKREFCRDFLEIWLATSTAPKQSVRKFCGEEQDKQEPAELQEISEPTLGSQIERRRVVRSDLRPPPFKSPQVIELLAKNHL